MKKKWHIVIIAVIFVGLFLSMAYLLNQKADEKIVIVLASVNCDELNNLLDLHNTCIYVEDANNDLTDLAECSGISIEGNMACKA